MNDLRELYDAVKFLLRAFEYLQPRMEGGALVPPQPMNPEALAGCIIHGCMSRVVREMQNQRQQMTAGSMQAPMGWITDPQAS